MFARRALAQSLAREFGPRGVHVAHAIIDGVIDIPRTRVPAFAGGLGGPVPFENIGGRAEFIAFSLDGSTQWLNPLTWPGAFRSGRAGTSLRSN